MQRENKQFWKKNPFGLNNEKRGWKMHWNATGFVGIEQKVKSSAQGLIFYCYHDLVYIHFPEQNVHL